MLIVVCEDNPAWLKWIGKTLHDNNNGTYELKLFDNVENLLEYSMSKKPDIAYLDIQIGKGNGLDAAKTLELINKDILIIYISAYEEYYYEALQTAPFRYIKKEGSYNERNVLRTLEEALVRKRSGFYKYKFSGRDYMINLSDVKYIYSQHREIHFSDGKNDIGYFYGRLDVVEKDIEKIDRMFLRVNKSILVNIRYATNVSLREVEICGMTFNLSKKYKDIFKKWVRNN